MNKDIRDTIIAYKDCPEILSGLIDLGDFTRQDVDTVLQAVDTASSNSKQVQKNSTNNDDLLQRYKATRKLSLAVSLAKKLKLKAKDREELYTLLNANDFHWHSKHGWCYDK